jgi:D-alanyl-D-alanine carboxypeptidase/D-alanyl-D-alanine-endopeptidase (penicillin-binding protein 4)
MPARKIRHITLPFLLLLFFTACSHKDDTGTALKTIPTDLNIDDSLRQRVAQYIERKPMDSLLAFYLYDITAEKPVYEYRKDALMPPASCLKLLTGIALLHRLGCTYKFNTQLCIHGPVSNGHLKGDLIIYSGYDPLLTSYELQPLFKAINEKGIKNIDGKVILDLGVNEYPQHEEHWIPGDLKRRKFGFFYQGQARIEQEIKYLIRSQGTVFKDEQLCWAKLPKGSKRIALQQTPIEEVVQLMWKNSANEKSESMLYPLGRYSGRTDSLRTAGLTYLQQFIKEELCRTDSCAVLHDGCGMCIHNRLSPSLIVDLLRYAHQHRDIFEIVQRTFPKGGIDGTLIHRLNKPHTKGKIIAKTGTLTRENGISSLSGYFKDRQGHVVCFAIMNNHIPIADAQLYQDKLCAEFFAKP